MREADKMRERKDWRTEYAEHDLRDWLSEGPLPAKVVWQWLEEEGITRGTAKRAKENIGVVSVRRGGSGAKGRWVWALEEHLKGDWLDRVDSLISEEDVLRARATPPDQKGA
jgi:hypothetical protein